jgi:hypothetical protein
LRAARRSVLAWRNEEPLWRGEGRRPLLADPASGPRCRCRFTWNGVICEFERRPKGTPSTFQPPGGVHAALARLEDGDGLMVPGYRTATMQA